MRPCAFLVSRSWEVGALYMVLAARPSMSDWSPEGWGGRRISLKRSRREEDVAFPPYRRSGGCTPHRVPLSRGDTPSLRYKEDGMQQRTYHRGTATAAGL